MEDGDDIPSGRPLSLALTTNALEEYLDSSVPLMTQNDVNIMTSQSRYHNYCMSQISTVLASARQVGTQL